MCGKHENINNISSPTPPSISKKEFATAEGVINQIESQLLLRGVNVDIVREEIIKASLYSNSDNTQKTECLAKGTLYTVREDGQLEKCVDNAEDYIDIGSIDSFYEVSTFNELIEPSVNITNSTLVVVPDENNLLDLQDFACSNSDNITMNPENFISNEELSKTPELLPPKSPQIITCSLPTSLLSDVSKTCQTIPTTSKNAKFQSMPISPAFEKHLFHPVPINTSCDK